MHAPVLLVTLLSFIIFAVWLLTLGRTIVNVALVPRLRQGSPGDEPLVSIVVPARDEERVIERTVRALLAQTYAKLEVVVVNDRSADRTGEILAGIDDSRLVVVQGEEPPPGWLGKPWALHEGASRARGELLLFVDADVHYAPGTVAATVAHFQRRGVSMLSLLPHFEMRGFWEHVAMPNLACFAFMFIPLWLSNRTRIALIGIGGGPGNLVRRREYEVAGGHEALRDAVIDDVGLARLMRKAGFRTEVVMARDFVSLRMYHGLREIVDGFTKNGFASFGRSYVAVTAAVVVTVVGTLLPLVLAFTLDPYAIATVAVITLARLILFIPLGYRIDNAVLGHVPMVLVWVWILVRSTWITGIRRQLHWRGRTYDARETRFGAD